MTALSSPDTVHTSVIKRTTLLAGGRSIIAPAVCAGFLLAVDWLAVLAATFMVSACFIPIWYYVTALPPPSATALRATPAIFLLAILYLASKGRYNRRIPFWTESGLVAAAAAYTATGGVMAGLLSNSGLSFASMIAVPMAFFAFATAGNQLTKLVLTRIGVWAVRVLAIGNGPDVAEARLAIDTDRSLGYQFVGRIDPTAVIMAPQPGQLWALLQQYRAHCLFIVLDRDHDRRTDIVDCALRERIPFILIPPRRTVPAFAGETMRLLGHRARFVTFRSGLSRPAARTAKTIMDISIAACLLVITSLLFLVIAALIRSDGGPALFAQKRVGAGGRPFLCLKFRTMVVDADQVLTDWLARDPALKAEWAATRKLTNDPRITRIGRFLRKTSLDELPQLINVLKLDMSLVGPRPIVESEIALYGDDIAQYYAGRPGLTGLWQVSGRSDTSYARRVELDTWYVNNWTVWNDVTVLIKTIPAVYRGQGAR